MSGNRTEKLVLKTYIRMYDICMYDICMYDITAEDIFLIWSPWVNFIPLGVKLPQV
jgi:hypothetical protein